MYNSESKAISAARRDAWTTAKGGFAVVVKDGKYDYIYPGTPAMNGELVVSRYVWCGRWRRYEWDGTRWVRV